MNLEIQTAINKLVVQSSNFSPVVMNKFETTFVLVFFSPDTYSS